MKTIGLILLMQVTTAPTVMFFIREYIEQNIVDTVESKTTGNILAVFKDGKTVRYDLPTRIVGFQVAVSFIGVILLNISNYL